MQDINGLLPLLSLLISFPASVLLTKLSIKLSERLGLLGEDVHKPERPKVPKVGGLGFVITYLTLMALFSLKSSDNYMLVLFVLAPLLAALIGLIEDLRELDPRLKPALLLIPGALVVLFGYYDPRPVLPFIGGVRITLLYPILVIAAYSVVANAVNSLDVLNGSLVATTVPVLALLAVLAYVVGRPESALASALMVVTLMGFAIYNWFPARTFSGNVGSLMVGAVITSVAISSSLELVAITALIPHIMNEFYLIAYMRGLKSGKALRVRPVELEGYTIKANRSVDAPITLVRMLTMTGGLKERELVIRLGLLSVYSSILATLTFLLMEV